MRLWSSMRRRPWLIVVGVVATRVFAVVMGADFNTSISWVIDVVSAVPLSYVILSRYKDSGPATAAVLAAFGLALFGAPGVLIIIASIGSLLAWVVVGGLVISFIAGLVAVVVVRVVETCRQLIATQGRGAPGVVDSIESISDPRTLGKGSQTRG